VNSLNNLNTAVIDSEYRGMHTEWQAS